MKIFTMGKKTQTAIFKNTQIKNPPSTQFMHEYDFYQVSPLIPLSHILLSNVTILDPKASNSKELLSHLCTLDVFIPLELLLMTSSLSHDLLPALLHLFQTLISQPLLESNADLLEIFLFTLSDTKLIAFLCGLLDEAKFQSKSKILQAAVEILYNICALLSTVTPSEITYCIMNHLYSIFTPAILKQL